MGATRPDPFETFADRTARLRVHDRALAYPRGARATDLCWYREFFGRAISFYRRPPFPVLQVVWPDAEGRYVWEPGADERYRQSQPQSWLKPTEHPHVTPPAH